MSESVWVPSPAAETAANIQKQAAGYCLHMDDPEALERAMMGIRRAIDEINTVNWSWTLSYDDFFFVAGQTDYALSSQFKAPHQFDVWDQPYARVHRLIYKGPKQYLTEYPFASRGGQGSPTSYSCLNAHSLGSISLDAPPTPEWVFENPNGRIWYYRNVSYPGSTSGVIDVPAKVSAFIQYMADGYTADAYAVQKAFAAYQRAERYMQKLIKDESDTETDWES